MYVFAKKSSIMYPAHGLGDNSGNQMNILQKFLEEEVVILQNEGNDEHTTGQCVL